MSVAGVLVLPEDPPGGSEGPSSRLLAQVVAELVGMGLRVFVPPAADLPPVLPPLLADTRRVASVAMWLRSQEAAGPIVVVALGDGGRLLPALALSQRAAGRLINGYVLVDSRAPAPAMDWPDAPVTWIATGVGEGVEADGALPARLRGFEVAELRDPAEAAAAALAAIVARKAGLPLAGAT